MSNTVFKAPRPIGEVEREYAQLVARYGQLDYQIKCMEKDKGVLFDTLQSLNQEAFAIKTAEAKAQAEAAQKSEDEQKAAELAQGPKLVEEPKKENS